MELPKSLQPSEEQLNKKASEIMIEHKHTDSLEAWIMRTAISLVVIAMSHERGEPLPVAQIQNTANVLVAYMPPELMMIALAGQNELMEKATEIIDLERLFEDSKEE